MAWGKANSGYWYMNFSNVSVENVHARPFDGVVVPFVFYILGMAEMILMLVSIPMVFCAENFAVVFHTTISLSAFLSIMIGNAILIAMARSRIHEMQHNSSRPYIEDAKVTSGFLGAGWGAAFAALLAGVLLLVDWRYEVEGAREGEKKG
ncbi:hypothetical protein H2200_009451 [Cladophialophora chaetospira]|uniref:Uncharacterized protein n=1 Tax=Cladophialophora chaetospira TaxID=386627 RepID=A0AA39CFQ7_9EURO|nr:hypothetical protein H2200_009451 [Cladophialophora chaetospira]